MVSHYVKLSCALGPGTWGSDHVRVNVIPHHALRKKRRTVQLTVWNAFSYNVGETMPYNLIHKITSALNKTTRVIPLPSCVPVPDLKYLNLTAARLRAERGTRKSGKSADWTSEKKVSGASQRPNNRLQRWQWLQIVLVDR